MLREKIISFFLLKLIDREKSMREIIFHLLSDFFKNIRKLTRMALPRLYNVKPIMQLII